MLTLARIALLAVLLPAAALSAQEPAANGSGVTGIVTVPLANIRVEPAPKAAIVTQVLLAETVRIIEKKDYLYRVSLPEQGGLAGWIHEAALLVPRDGGAAFFQPGREWVIVSAPKASVLILNKLGDHAVPLYAGTRLPVLERSEDGVTVQFPDRKTRAIVSPEDVRPLERGHSLFRSVAPQDLARTARKFAGAPSFSGGITAQGMDARGLIYTVYRIHGIDLDMERSALKARAQTVSRKDLLPGDVLTFHGEGLGLFIGNGQFLHAPRKGRLQIAGIHDRRYANALQVGLRVLGPDPEERRTPAFMLPDEIMVAQGRIAGLPVGRRIVYWAGRFLGTPYDPDPLGLYVRTNRIVADEKADCMYLTFRAVELARSLTPGEAVEQALSLRFLAAGRVADGLVQNYAERFEYGEDMVFSGKWGRNITAELGDVRTIPGSRGRDQVEVLPKSVLGRKKVGKQLADGDIIYWVKDPQKRVVGEIVAHLSFVHIKDGKPHLIHASGTKDNGKRPGNGVVREVLLADYLRGTKFIGAFVTRFEE